MVVEINLLGNSPLVRPAGGTDRRSDVQMPREGKDFKGLLMETIDEVNHLQAESRRAQIDLVTGRTENVDEVFAAMQKAGLAFQLLVQIRNKLLEAYDEIKQMRV
jgi:flagellar hook-basal body complex protein FliE